MTIIGGSFITQVHPVILALEYGYVDRYNNAHHARSFKIIISLLL